MDSLFKASLREDGDETMIERRGDANRLAPADEDVFAFGETGEFDGFDSVDTAERAPAAASEEVLAQEPGHRSPPPAVAGRHRARPSGSGDSGSPTSTRRIRSSPNVRASRASCQPSRAFRAACGTNSGSC